MTARVCSAVSHSLSDCLYRLCCCVSFPVLSALRIRQLILEFVSAERSRFQDKEMKEERTENGLDCTDSQDNGAAQQLPDSCKKESIYEVTMLRFDEKVKICLDFPLGIFHLTNDRLSLIVKERFSEIIELSSTSQSSSSASSFWELFFLEELRHMTNFQFILECSSLRSNKMNPSSHDSACCA